jgi:surfeit locus 1 family protein
VTRVFAPRAGLTLLALALAALFVALGIWQWRRYVLRSAERQRFERGAAELKDLHDLPLAAVPLFQRVRVAGRLDGEHQFLLDNRTHAGQAGYEVLTPLARPTGERLLVDRGWVPFRGRRSELPDVRLAVPQPLELTGRSAALPSPGLASGRAAPGAAAPWPKVTSYPDMPELSRALGVPLSTRVLLLDPQAPFGYLRDWQAPGLTPLTHLSYAIQWWSFAVLTLIGWAVASRRTAGAP